MDDGNNNRINEVTTASIYKCYPSKHILDFKNRKRKVQEKINESWKKNTKI